MALAWTVRPTGLVILLAAALGYESLLAVRISSMTTKNTLLVFLSLVGLVCASPAFGAQQPPPDAVALSIDGAIGPATSSYVAKGIRSAEKADAPLIVLRIDTPGGLDGAMREIVKTILSSPIPVLGYVAPSGARAASAGTYILYATHIAAMAPATNLGAATPVSLGGDSPLPGTSPGKHEDKNKKEPADGGSVSAERRKVVNDAVAYIRSLAEKRGRNADWAEQAVRGAASLSAHEALQRNVIDLIAPSTTALLRAVNGRTVETSAGKVTLATQGLRVREQEPGWRTRLLAVITNPTVAYILMMIGIYGLILEGFNPGAVLPGVLGSICLLVALFAFQILPVNYAGFALLALGTGLMVAEAFAPSFGILGLGGVAAFVFGSVMLMDTGVPGYDISLGIIAGIAVAAALLMLLIITLFVRSRRERVVTGSEGLLGSRGVALTDIDDTGRVLVHGEDWRAHSAQAIRTGQPVRITAVDGLTLTVEPAVEREK